MAFAGIDGNVTSGVLLGAHFVDSRHYSLSRRTFALTGTFNVSRSTCYCINVLYLPFQEEIDTITKSVVFSDEVVDNEDSSNQKLIRRDTPHYTKRARIHHKNSDGGKHFVESI